MLISPSYKDYSVLIELLKNNGFSSFAVHDESANHPFLPNGFNEEKAISSSITEKLLSFMLNGFAVAIIGDTLLAKEIFDKCDAANGLLDNKIEIHHSNDPMEFNNKTVIFVDTGLFKDNLEQMKNLSKTYQVVLYTPFPQLKEIFNSSGLFPNATMVSIPTKEEFSIINKRLSYIHSYLNIRKKKITHFQFPTVVDENMIINGYEDDYFVPSLLSYVLKDSFDKGFSKEALEDLVDILFNNYAPFDLRYSFLLQSYSFDNPLRNYSSRIYASINNSCISSNENINCDTSIDFDRIIASINRNDDIHKVYNNDPILDYYLITLSMIRYVLE